MHWGDTVHAGLTIHDLRHYAASAWLRAGIPAHQVSQWLGHANPNTTLQVYAHVLGESQDLAAIARLNSIEPSPRSDALTEGSHPWDPLSTGGLGI